ncbi:hypothetical protein B0H67DRAFT_188120 [Lasiosphaeris hirsuta]|uniref:Uncharacterized protein n=1 Tax=Lasiosphaeris hirsuta TaxID=260670 RepID=A0AA40AR30_9PEZI|nr:hypothetical protein B0H67DRAFT_188120 [Lasiosphaeris hirsuta]
MPPALLLRNMPLFVVISRTNTQTYCLYLLCYYIPYIGNLSNRPSYSSPACLSLVTSSVNWQMVHRVGRRFSLFLLLGFGAAFSINHTVSTV